MLTRLTIAATSALLLVLASAAAADDATVAVTSHPEGAKIYVNGYFKARTPATVVIGSATEVEQPYTFT
ncbi:MAG TPA: hypothetical protein DEP45_09320, partial [Armatimonadetes bacterium]|nr:hypothetical protein [Armatimonadota bacterium]